MASYDDDIAYVKYFPKGEKYIALFPSANSKHKVCSAIRATTTTVLCMLQLTQMTELILLTTYASTTIAVPSFCAGGIQGW
jgi:hypothetical protein